MKSLPLGEDVFSTTNLGQYVTQVLWNICNKISESNDLKCTSLAGVSHKTEYSSNNDFFSSCLCYSSRKTRHVFTAIAATSSSRDPLNISRDRFKMAACTWFGIVFKQGKLFKGLIGTIWGGKKAMVRDDKHTGWRQYSTSV